MWRYTNFTLPAKLVPPMVQKTRPFRRKPDTPRRWLVLSAWEPELSELRRLLDTKPKSSSIVVACAGVGLVEAAMGATLAIASAEPDAVIFVGTAGRYRNRLPNSRMGEVVAARELRLWSEEVDAGNAYFPAPLPAVIKTTAPMRRRAVAQGLPLVRVACPLAITTQTAGRADSPDVENLEAFAVGRAAARRGLPFMAILGISNLVGPSAHAQWKKHARAAAAAACRAAHAVVAEPEPEAHHREHRGHRD